MFLQGLLEGIASIEAEAYALLDTLGATAVTKVTVMILYPHHIIFHIVWPDVQTRLGMPIHAVSVTMTV